MAKTSKTDANCRLFEQNTPPTKKSHPMLYKTKFLSDLTNY